MACPGGCLNGGGQIKPKEMGMDPKALLEMLETQMRSMDYKELVPNPEDNRSIKQLLQMMAMTYDKWEETKFKAVPKDIVSTHNIKW